MSDAAFWNLVERAKVASGASLDARADALAQLLFAERAEVIAAFDRWLHEQLARANTWDLWAAAYIIGEGCSDDSFVDFRLWLVSRGRSTFEAAVADAESLADVEPDDDVFFEELGYIAVRVYEQKTGRPLRTEPAPPAEPRGEPFEEDADSLAARLPRVYRTFSTR